MIQSYQYHIQLMIEVTSILIIHFPEPHRDDHPLPILNDWVGYV